MKKIFLAILSISLFFNCGGESTGKRVVSAPSSGNINTLAVVIDNDLWDGSIGETIREIYAAEIWGLPQQEPLFSLSQIPTAVFSDFVTRNRIILKVEKGKPADTRYLENVYAKPQRVVLVTGNTNAEIVEQLKNSAGKAIAILKATEIKERQRRIQKSLLVDKPIEDALGINLKIPSAYRFAKEKDGFFWLRRDIKNGDVNMLIYEMPLNAITKGEDAITDIIRMRDSIGKVHIPGPLDGTYMITEEAYTPFSGTTIIDNKPAFETKSTWEVKDAFMAGPFINYAIEDEVNNRLLVIEGFVFAPSMGKRDYIFELESIIKSIQFKS